MIDEKQLISHLYQNRENGQLHQFSSLKQEIQSTTTRTGIPPCRLHTGKGEQTISEGKKELPSPHLTDSKGDIVTEEKNNLLIRIDNHG